MIGLISLLHSGREVSLLFEKIRKINGGLSINVIEKDGSHNLEIKDQVTKKAMVHLLTPSPFKIENIRVRAQG